MSEKIVEPSEILVDGDGTIRDEPIRANPWLRFIGRMFDYSLFFTALWALRKQFGGVLPFGEVESFIPFEYFVWMPIEAAFLFLIGTTPGKWVLGTDVRQGRKKKLDYLTALRRSFNVWFRGIAMGIPVLNAFCMLIAYHRLKMFKITSWDLDDHIQVTHHPIAQWRFVFAVIVAVAGLLFHFGMKSTLIHS
jgi:hypothetical protein